MHTAFHRLHDGAPMCVLSLSWARSRRYVVHMLQPCCDRIDLLRVRLHVQLALDLAPGQVIPVMYKWEMIPGVASPEWHAKACYHV
jgi:hypothetical protein